MYREFFVPLYKYVEFKRKFIREYYIQRKITTYCFDFSPLNIVISHLVYEIKSVRSHNSVVSMLSISSSLFTLHYSRNEYSMSKYISTTNNK